MSSKLLSTTSPPYLRRLVKELNAHGVVDGFYALIGTDRCNRRARCTRAALHQGRIVVAEAGSNAWFPCNQIFTDPQGREVWASRRA